MDVKEEVRKIISKRIDVSGLKEDDNLSSLGLDSLDLVEVMLEIEEVFSIEFANEEIEQCKTFKDMLDLISQKVK